MNKYAILFEYFRKCPYLADMMSLASRSRQGESVILTRGASPAVDYIETVDSLGNYQCIVEPYPSVYEDFQINCYAPCDASDSNPPVYNANVLTYEQVCGVCEWVAEQNDRGNFPQIGERIVAIECTPFVPRYHSADVGGNVICYFVTVRLRYVNRAQRRIIEYPATERSDNYGTASPQPIHHLY